MLLAVRLVVERVRGVSLICLTDLDTLICLDCERHDKRVRPREGFSGVHSVKHPLLRINDSMDVDTIELKASRMERQLSNIERRINTSIDEGLLALEQKVGGVNTQLEGVKKEVNDIAKHLENRAPSLEAGPASSISVETKPIPEHNDRPSGDPLQANTPSSYETRLEARLDALENKVDNQFGRLLAMMEEVLLVSRRDDSSKA